MKTAEIETLKFGEVKSEFLKQKLEEWIVALLPEQLELLDTHEVYIYDPKILKSVIDHFSRVRTNVLNAWFVWNIILSLKFALPLRLREIISPFHHNKSTLIDERWCMNQVLHAIPLTFTRAYEKEYDMSRSIRKVFQETLITNLNIIEKVCDIS